MQRRNSFETKRIDVFKKKETIIGKETLLKQKKNGLDRQLVVLTTKESEFYPQGGEPIWWLVLPLVKFHCFQPI